MIIMDFVEPIRDLKKIAQIKNMIKWSWNIRDLLLFELGINSALRISDLLNIKIINLFDENGNPNEFFEIKEKKTNKINRITITPKVMETLKIYKNIYNNNLENWQNYVFFHFKKYPQWKFVIGRKQARKLIDEWCNNVWLKGNFWCHSLRKTRGYHARMQWIPLEIIQHKLNHSSLAITQRYLWITADEIEQACRKLDL